MRKTQEKIRKGIILAAASFAITLALAALLHSPFAALISLAISTFLGMKLEGSNFREFIKNYGWIIVTTALIALFLTANIKPAIFAILLLLHAATSVIFRSIKNSSRVSIEFTMLITILASFAYGAKTGAVLGAVSMLMDYAFSARFSYFMPVTIITYALIGFFAASFAGFGITAVGIAATVIYSIVTSTIIILFMGGHPQKCVTFGITDIALNILLFTAVAPWLLSILT